MRKFPLLMLLILAACAAPRAGTSANAPNATGGDDAAASQPGMTTAAPLPAGTLADMRNAAFTAMNDGRWTEALPYWQRIIEVQGGAFFDENYQLAACYAQMGDKARAVEYLRIVYEANGDLNLDDNFLSLTGDPAFEALMKEVVMAGEKYRESLGTMLEVESPVLQSLRVRLPKDYDSEKEYPLVIGLHGFGGNSERFITLYDNISYGPEFIYAALDAPYPAGPQSDFADGRSWWPTDGTADAAAYGFRLSGNFVMRALETLRNTYSIDRNNVYLLGFSQGAALAAKQGFDDPITFAGFIMVAGRYDQPAPVFKGDHKPSVLICHGELDGIEGARQMKTLFTNAGCNVSMEEHDGGHEINDTVTSAVVRWLQESIAEKS